MDLVRWTADFFKKHDVPSPRLDAELLLAHVLDVKRMDLYLAFDQPVAEADRARSASWCGGARRSAARSRI